MDTPVKNSLLDKSVENVSLQLSKDVVKRRLSLLSKQDATTPDIKPKPSSPLAGAADALDLINKAITLASPSKNVPTMPAPPPVVKVPAKRTTLADLNNSNSEEVPTPKPEPLGSVPIAVTDPAASSSSSSSDDDDDAMEISSVNIPKKPVKPLFIDGEAANSEDGSGDDDDDADEAAEDVDDDGNIKDLIAADDDDDDDDAMDIATEKNAKASKKTSKAKRRAKDDLESAAELNRLKRKEDEMRERLIIASLTKNRTARSDFDKLLGSKSGGIRKRDALKLETLRKHQEIREQRQLASDDDDDDDGSGEADSFNMDISGSGDDLSELARISADSEVDDEEEEEEEQDANSKDAKSTTLDALASAIAKDLSIVKSAPIPKSSSVITLDADDLVHPQEAAPAAAPTIATTTKKPLVVPAQQSTTLDNDALCQETSAAVYERCVKSDLFRDYAKTFSMGDVLNYVQGLDAVLHNGPVVPGSGTKAGASTMQHVKSFADQMSIRLDTILTRINTVTENSDAPWAARLNIVLLMVLGDADIVESLHAETALTCAFTGTPIPAGAMYHMLIVNAPNISKEVFAFPFTPQVAASVAWLRPPLVREQRMTVGQMMGATPTPDPELAKRFHIVPIADMKRPESVRDIVADNAAEEEEEEEENEAMPDADEEEEEDATDPKDLFDLINDGSLQMRLVAPEILYNWLTEVSAAHADQNQLVASVVDPASSKKKLATHFRANGYPTALVDFKSELPQHVWAKNAMKAMMRTLFELHPPSTDGQWKGLSSAFPDCIVFDQKTRKNMPLLNALNSWLSDMNQDLFKLLIRNAFDGSTLEGANFTKNERESDTNLFYIIAERPFKIASRPVLVRFNTANSNEVETGKHRFFPRLLATLFFPKPVYFSTA